MERNLRKTRVGKVVSNKMDKTIVVAVEDHVKHPLYNIDLNNKKLIEQLSKLRNSRHDYLFNVANKLNELGYKVNTEELDKIEAVTKAHISLDVISNKENEKTLLDNFGHIPSKGEFIETIMNENCPAYVKKESITPNLN